MLPLALELLATHAWLQRVVVHGNTFRHDRRLAQPTNWTAVVERERLALVWRSNHGFDPHFHDLPAILRTLGKPAFTTVSIARGNTSAKVDGVRTELMQVLARWPRLATTTLF